MPQPCLAREDVYIRIVPCNGRPHNFANVMARILAVAKDCGITVEYKGGQYIIENVGEEEIILKIISGNKLEMVKTNEMRIGINVG